jgi:ADP-ribose pyrophosphatase
MSDSFQWEEVRTEYRGVNSSPSGDELRWLVNRERVRNTRNGKVVTRAVIRHPGIAVIVPFVSDEEILLMRQFRYAVNRELWEVPAGTVDAHEADNRMRPAEAPEECAARELTEETGYAADELVKVAECYAMPGSSDEIMHIFFARQLTQREQSLDEGEVINEIRPFRLTEIEAMILRGDIRDAKTLIALFYALRRPASGQSVRG